MTAGYDPKYVLGLIKAGTPEPAFRDRRRDLPRQPVGRRSIIEAYDHRILREFRRCHSWYGFNQVLAWFLGPVVIVIGLYTITQLSIYIALGAMITFVGGLILAQGVWGLCRHRRLADLVERAVSAGPTRRPQRIRSPYRKVREEDRRRTRQGHVRKVKISNNRDRLHRARRSYALLETFVLCAIGILPFFFAMCCALVLLVEGQGATITAEGFFIPAAQVFWFAMLFSPLGVVLVIYSLHRYQKKQLEEPIW